MLFRIVPLSLLVALAAQAATPNVNPESVAGNEAVRKIMETYGGRGTLADKTPPQKPADALKMFQGRSDVAVDLVAAEPDVAQPLYLSFDSKGRMWVMQYIQYQFPAGLKVVSYDQHLRAKFDKVPKPPPLGEKGADKVTIFEDTDGDGLYDKHTDAITGLNIATSAITGAGSIWVTNPPYLLRYPDANDDGIPDGDPEVALSGFGLEDTHSVVNNLKWGPDGWLYGVNGSTTTGNVSSAATKNVKWEGQMVWRYHPKTKVFEIYGEGGGNPFSLDIDSKGRVFTGTNGGGTRGMHFDQGMYGIKNWGKHGPLTNPYAFGWFEHMESEGDKRRFPQAFAIYEGGVLGSAYEGRVIAPNALANVVWVSERIATGSTFKTKDEENMLTTTDRWFRPVNIQTGPDGCLYMADWYDTRLSHVRPVDDWSKKDGRIYRIRPASGAPKVKPFNMHTAPADELLGYLNHTNEWMRKQAVNEIGWRELKELTPKLKAMASQQDDPHALDAFFGLDVLDSVDDAYAAEMLDHKDPYVRRWAVKIIGDKGTKWSTSTTKLAALAVHETQPEVIIQLAASAKRLPAAANLAIVRQLIEHGDAKDPRLPLMTWWAIESKADKGAAEVLNLFADKAVWGFALSKTLLVKNIAKRWALAGGEANFQACAKLLGQAPDEESRGQVVAGLASAFEGAEMPALPKELSVPLNQYLKTQSGDDITLSVRSGDAEAAQQALKILKDKTAPVAKRAAIALVLAEMGKKEVLEPLLAVFSAPANEALKRALLPAVAKFEDHKIVTAMLDGYEQRIAGEKTLRESALRTMAGRKDWAKMLIHAVDTWKVPEKHVPIDIIRQLSLFNDPDINAAIDKHWPGKLAAAPTEDIIKDNKRIKEVLRGGLGEAAKGKVLFTQRCAICHKLFGEGNAIAPELTGYERGNLDFWLTAILTPSIEIREGFGLYVVKLKNGQILSGIMAGQDAKGITLRDVANQLTPIKQTDIVSLEASPISLMPQGMLTGISDTDLRDLFAYMMKMD
ncbi:MAG: putative heme-binding protein [Verrucomicrobiaceae bacterium]|nr:putative heme-binding protein [Verrucomicrobiaceae bacterium]